MKYLLYPESVCVIGASRNPQKLGYAILKNVIDSGFKGDIFPVNPSGEEILGYKSFPDVKSIKDRAHLAVITIPSRFVIETIKECGENGVKAIVVISAGFRETGHKGLMAEMEIARLAEEYNMDIVGPNCLGLINTHTPVNASFAAGMPLKGNIAFMSQSGALCTAVLDMSFNLGIGFSTFVSLGNKAHINEVDFLSAFDNDPNSSVALAYLEGISNGGLFIKKARDISKRKPIVAIKSGTTDAGSRAVSSHTGTLAGSEKAYEAAFKQAGVIRAGTVSDLFDISWAFSTQPLPTTERIAIVTNAGGPGILATDMAERKGLKLASLTSETMEELAKSLPSAASVLNPVDVLGDALSDRYKVAIKLVLEDPNVGGVIVILTPQIMTEIEETANVIIELSKQYNKPILTSFMGDATTGKGVAILSRNKIPNYPIPERAVYALKEMVNYRLWQDVQDEEITEFEFDNEKINNIFQKALSKGRLTLGETDAKQIMEAIGMKVPPSKLCSSADEAIKFADEIGYPVVMKIASPDILHKTDVGGVKLDVRTPEDVRDSFDLITMRSMRYMPNAEIWGCNVQKQLPKAREMIIGVNRDTQFGPLVMAGLGGIYVEVLKDVAFRIAPFSRKTAREMLFEIKTINLIRGVRGQAPGDINGIIDTLIRISQLVTRFPNIVELDINPLFVYEEGKGVVGLDMRLALKP